jgi:heme/copper-type cytochrome/quinol oxidase subunit 2
MPSTAAVRPLALVAVVALLAACGDDSASDGVAEDSRRVATLTGDTHRPDTAAGDAIHIEVTARSFAFEPDEITVPAGEEVGIVLTSTDSEHDFVIDELGVHVHADAGETAFGTFRADEPGRYTIYCSLDGHREAGMEAVLVVEA